MRLSIPILFSTLGNLIEADAFYPVNPKISVEAITDFNRGQDRFVLARPVAPHLTTEKIRQFKHFILPDTPQKQDPWSKFKKMGLMMSAGLVAVFTMHFYVKMQEINRLEKFYLTEYKNLIELKSLIMHSLHPFNPASASVLIELIHQGIAKLRLQQNDFRELHQHDMNKRYNLGVESPEILEQSFYDLQKMINNMVMNHVSSKSYRH